MAEPIGDPALLIDRLAADLRPVRRLASPWRRTALWLVAVLWIGLLLSFFTNWTLFWLRMMSVPDMWLSQLGALFTAILSSFAALQTAVPGRSDWWPLLPLPALVIWVSGSTAGCLRLWPAPATVPEPRMHGWQCVEFLLMVSVPLSVLLTWLLVRACPLRPGVTAALCGLASAGAAATLLNLVHPFDATSGDLLLHAFAVLAVVGGTRAGAGRAMRQARRSLTRS